MSSQVYPLLSFPLVSFSLGIGSTTDTCLNTLGTLWFMENSRLIRAVYWGVFSGLIKACLVQAPWSTLNLSRATRSPQHQDLPLQSTISPLDIRYPPET
jgi:hypothetical protein